MTSRVEFREAVFKRDRGLCVHCSAPAVDAHHIMERRLWPCGGYYVDNGASLCAACHILAEKTDLTVEQLREECGIKTKLLPPHLYADAVYDKWGNQQVGDGWLRGELFHDPSVQKILTHKLPLFKPWVKYPRTYHLPWSPGMNDDDRQHSTLLGFEGREVVVTEKMDGENTTLYPTHIHARSVDGRSHPSQSWVRNFHSQVAHEIPFGWRVCGENLYARHSVSYTGLPTYFMGFSVWDYSNICLSWDQTLEFFELVDITPVPVLYQGIFDVETIKSLQGDWNTREGYVVRIADAFHYSQFRCVVGKSVRAGHVNTVEHWRTKWEKNV